jgi:hypothetical protein
VGNEDETRTDTFAKGKVRVINRDVVGFVFFLFLSFILWYLNSLGKEVDASMSYPIKYINVPSGKLVREITPMSMDLYLKGPGYSILKLKLLENRNPVEIDISKVNYKRVPGSKTLSYFILSSGLNKNLALQLRSGCEVISVRPDTLFFTFEKNDGRILSPGYDVSTVRNGKN